MVEALDSPDLQQHQNMERARDMSRPDSQNIAPEDEESMPHQLAEYVEQHNLDNVVNQVVNKVLKERPTDPVQMIA